MKKTLILVGSIVLTLALSITILVFRNAQYKDALEEDENKPLEVGEFSLDVFANKHQWFFDNFASDKNIGEITNAETAAQKAKEHILDTTKGIDENHQCFQRKWVRVDYDSENDCWHIYNETDKKSVGGVTHVFVYSNGDVICSYIED